jgi:hypothetical protein
VIKRGKHVEGVKRILDPEAFEDFTRRHGQVLEMREEVADKFKDLNPDGVENLMPEGFPGLHPWMANWIRERGGWDLKKNDRLEFETLREFLHRFNVFFRVAREYLKEKPSVEELVTTKWLSYLSVPPIFTVRADLAASTNQLLFGKYATVMFPAIDYWKAEFFLCGGYHLEEGLPTTFWTVGITEDINQMDEKDIELMKNAAPKYSLPAEVPDVEAWARNMNRKHLRLGIRLRDCPKKCPHSIPEMVKPARGILMDLREEMFAEWGHATLYMALWPGIFGCGTQQNFFGMSQWWCDPWTAINATRIYGWPLQLYTYTPLPPILNTMLTMPLEMWKRRLSVLYFTGPKGILLDPVTKLYVPEDRAPLIHDIRRLMFEEGKMYKNFALPRDNGIPPPPALFTSMPCPFYKEGNVRDFFTNPDNLSKEYWELLESEGGINRKTGHIPTYAEVPRLKWLFDPNFEWLKPTDFPPVDWSKGQVWPIDVTREKMELMVEEGYDGSGKDILHYSALADKKMGQLGKIIMLGTMPYKLPVCGCSPKCS